MGDFNIHTDNPNYRGAIELWHTLTNFGLTQHDKKQQHKERHILGLIITKGLNNSTVSVTDAALWYLTTFHSFLRACVLQLTHLAFE